MFVSPNCGRSKRLQSFIELETRPFASELGPAIAGRIGRRDVRMRKRVAKKDGIHDESYGSRGGKLFEVFVESS